MGGGAYNCWGGGDVPDEEDTRRVRRYKPRTVTTLAARLDTGSIPEPNSGCFLWIRTVNNRGYGQITYRGRPILAHRAAWEVAHAKKIPAGALVLHSCDNPSCVNPSHLRLGDASENASDAVARGRHFQAKKTVCAHGHSLDNAPKRTRASGRRERVCVECMRTAGREYMRRLRGAV